MLNETHTNIYTGPRLYLQRFERFAKSNKWNESIWATSLSALLTGKALDVYSRMSETAAVDYKELKEALLKRYDLTENGFRVRFRNSKPEEGESPEQFITRLKRYLTRWIDLAKTEKSFEALCELFVKEQLIDACPEDLAIYLRERDPENLDEAAKVAEQFLIAHGKKLHSPSKPPKGKYPPSGSTRSEKGGKPGGRMQGFTCGGYGHKAIECSKNPNKSPPKVEKRCFLCDRTGHLARECKLMRDKKNTEKAGAALHDQGPPPPQENDTSLESCIHGDQLLLRNGKTLPFIKSGSVSLVDSTVRKMPVVRGRVGENIVDTLRDTGCSGVVVRRSLVVDEQLTGRVGYMLLIDNTLREVPLAEITVDTPYLRGQVEAQCLPETIYDLIIGNVPGARAPDDPDPTWREASAVTTRAQAKKSSTLKPLRIPEELRGSAVDRNDLSRLQREDPSLEKYRSP